jgi:uncharacterized protein YjbJ (UPF0337 family)
LSESLALSARSRHVAALATKPQPTWRVECIDAQNMNKDELEGKVEKVGGQIKEAAGTATGNKRLESEGERDRGRGAIKEGIGRARGKVGEAFRKVGEAIEHGKK